MTMPSTITSLRKKLKRKSSYDLALEQLEPYKTYEGLYDPFKAYEGGIDRDLLSELFGEETVANVERQEEMIKAVEPYRIDETSYDLRRAYEGGVPEETLRELFGDEIFGQLEKPETAPAAVQTQPQYLIPSIQAETPLLTEGFQWQSDEQQHEFEQQVLPQLPQELRAQYANIPMEEFIGLYDIWREGKREDLTVLMVDLMPEYFENLNEEQRKSIAMQFLEKLQTDERTQEFFHSMLNKKGRTAETENILKALMPGITERDIRIIFGENVIPLNELPIAAYKVSEQPLQDVIDFAIKDGNGLRMAMRYEGHTPETESMLKAVYGEESITDEYLKKYFEETVADSFVQGKWLPQVLQDYFWDPAMQGVSGILSGAGAVFDRLGADGLAKELQLAGAYGQVYGKDIPETVKYSPGWFAQQMSRMIPMIAAIAPISLITGGTGAGVIASAGGGTFLQAVGAATISGVTASVGEGMLEAGDAWNEAKRRGFSDEEANAVFDKVFMGNVGGLSLSNIAQYGLTFFVPGGRTASFFVKGLTYGFDVATEGMEEAGQLMIQRAALGDAQKFDDEMLQNFVLGSAGGFGFAAAGTVHGLIHSKLEGKMETSQYEQLRKSIQTYMGMGMSRKEAEAKAWDEFAGTPEGEALIGETVAEIKAEEAAETNKDKPKVQAAVKEITAEIAPVNPRVDAFVEEVTGIKVEEAAKPNAETLKSLNEHLLEMASRDYYRTVSGDIVEAPSTFPATSKTYTLDEIKELPPDTIITAKYYSAKRGGVARHKLKVKDIILPETAAKPTESDIDWLPEKEREAVEYYRNVQELEELKSTLDPEGAYGLLYLLKKGDIEYLTKDQYRKAIGREPSLAIIKPYTKTVIIKARTSEKGKYISEKRYEKKIEGIPWEYALDELASERGYESAEDLKEAIEKSGKTLERIRELESKTKEKPPISKGAEYIVEVKEDKLKKLKESFRHYRAKKQTQQEIKEDIADYINSLLPVSERGKFLTATVNAETEADMRRILERVDEQWAKGVKDSLKAQIRSELYKSLPRIKGGIKRGRFTAEIQTQLDIIRNNIDGDRSEAIEKIAKNIEAIENYKEGEIIYGDLLVSNELLEMTGIDEMSVEELKKTLDYIKSVKNYGRADRTDAYQKFIARMENVKEDVVKVLTGGEGLKPGAASLAKEAAIPKSSILEKLVNRQYGWVDLLDKASKKIKSTPFQSGLSKFGSIVMRARDAENARVQRIAAGVQSKAREIFGFKNNATLNTILNRISHEKIEVGKFKVTDATGPHLVTLEMTRGEMMKKYQEFQDPSLDETFDKGMGWNQEIRDAITSKLHAKEKAWADYQMEFYNKYYKDINKVYREIYGIDLAHNENYSPLSRDFEAKVPEQQLVYREMARWASVNNGSLKTRLRNIRPLKQVDANRSFINHIIQMEHFINWAEPMRELRTVFMDKNVRIAITQYHGKDILNQIDSYIQDFARGGVNKALINHFFDKLRMNFAKSVLGFKPAIALQQIPTVFAYLTEMKLGDFISGVADFWTHPIENYRWMMANVPYIKERYGTAMERDIRFTDAKGSIMGSPINTNVYFLMTIGDKLGVLQGWWAKYRTSLKAGMTQEQAMAEANDATDRTQNTSSIDTLSAWQRGGTGWKLLTMFMSQPNKYFRIIANNIRNFQYGRVSRVKAMSNVLLAWVLLPGLFTYIASGFRFKKEREISDVLLAPVNDLLFFGTISQTVNDWLVGENFDFQLTPVEAPIKDLKYFVQKALKTWDLGNDPYKEITNEDWIALMESFLKPAGELTGLPTPYLIQVEKGLRAGDPRQIVFSQWALEEPKADAKTKASEKVNELGLQMEDPTAPPDKLPEVYGMIDLYGYYKVLFAKNLPADITIKNGYDLLAELWGEAALNEDYINSLPNKKLFEIVDDIEKDDSLVWTFAQYYQEWQGRQKITSLSELKEFDRVNPRAYLGNITRRQYELLLQYEGLNKLERAQFLKDHSELLVNPRNEWLTSHPKENALLALWGKSKILTKDAYNEFKKLVEEYDIPDSALPERTLPPDESVDNYFNYLAEVDKRSASSWEAQLIIANDNTLREFLGREMVETPVESLKLKIKHRPLYDLMAGYSDRDAAGYIEDDGARADAIKKLKADNPEWLDDIRRLEAIENAGAQYQEKWVERGRLVDRAGTNTSEAKVWLLDNPDVFKWALDQKILTDDGSDWNVPVLRINVKWRVQDEEYNALPVEGTARADYLAVDEEYRMDRRRRDALQITGTGGEAFPAGQVENYVAYYELPESGKRRDRYLMENPKFAAAMHEIAGIDLPERVPSVQYDDIYDQYQEQFDRMEGLADNNSDYYIEGMKARQRAREEMRYKGGRLTEFGVAEIRRNAYGRYIPDEYVERYVDYYKLLDEGIPDDWPEDWHNNRLEYYEDDWYLIEHPAFYENIYLGLLELEKRDFSKVPSREVFQQYAEYSLLTEGKPREDYRWEHPELEEWLLLTKKVTTPIKEKRRRAKMTPKEKKKEDIAKLKKKLER